MSCSCLQVPTTAMRVWRGLSARLGLHRPCRAGAAGELGRLRKEVRTCEYGDVHVMWEMLSSKPSSGGDDAAGQDDGEEARRLRRRLEPAGVLLLRALMASVWCGPSRAQPSEPRAEAELLICICICSVDSVSDRERSGRSVLVRPTSLKLLLLSVPLRVCTYRRLLLMILVHVQWCYCIL